MRSENLLTGGVFDDKFVEFFTIKRDKSPARAGAVDGILLRELRMLTGHVTEFHGFLGHFITRYNEDPI